MTDWKQLEPAICETVGKLPPNGYLAIRNEACLMQFAVLENDGSRVLRAEVCRDSPEDEPRLRDRGWELVDTWSGLWRRDIPASADAKSVQALVLESINALRISFGVREPEGFTYLSWQESPPKAGWQFWKSGEDKDLKWSDLGLKKGKDRVD
ncbi:MAG: hypothetical protein Q4P15_09140 [Propionibacteriaceae bacterium]|nr:hypothetical protein [Propionibacteriaceae bacterium]